MLSLKSYGFILLITLMQISNAMQNDMTQIISWRDIQPFAGSLVTYTTPTHYFTLGVKNPINNNEQVHYGYIEEEPTYYDHISETGYKMLQLLAPEQFAGACSLTDSTLKNSNMRMRKSIAEEILQICKALATNKAKFAHGPKIIIESTSKKYTIKAYKKKQQKAGNIKHSKL